MGGLLSATAGVAARGSSPPSQVRDASRCILGHTRATLIRASRNDAPLYGGVDLLREEWALANTNRAEDRGLQLSLVNEEHLVDARH